MGDNIYVVGKCFICQKTEDMIEGAYAHYNCCIAYTDHKIKIAREIQENKEKRYDRT